MFKQGSGVLWPQWAPLPLRVVIGYGFVAHGWAKLSRGPAGFDFGDQLFGGPSTDRIRHSIDWWKIGNRGIVVSRADLIRADRLRVIELPLQNARDHGRPA